ncbi:MAG TPA: gephyrin-like molybdotransferase Glp [Terriglobia bacterium]|nr:gephyrin-like molybdotransferase Glp [Terriglobia bacterium]
MSGDAFQMRRSGSQPIATMLSYEQALSTVEEKLSAAKISPQIETVPLHQAWGRILAEDVKADRDYPPFHRATRDGFAVRAQDVPRASVVLKLAGEVRAGEHFPDPVEAGHCVQIMTGAPLPTGADAVIMIEHARVQGEAVEMQRPPEAFENVVRQGSEAEKGRQILPPGRRLGAGEIGLLASVGKASICVCGKPSVAILPTGDEIVPVDQQPEWFQIRNSNSAMLSAQVLSAGAIPCEMSVGPDAKQPLRSLVQEGLKADLLLLSGGVSMGKYDFVEEILADLGAEFYFQSVAIRPGKPLVFGRVHSTFFFGLPGNPVSSFVTFELFARPAIRVLGGGNFERPEFFRARLEQAVRHKAGLTMFMPARVETRDSEPVVRLVGWQGSGDLVGVAEANCFLVIHPEQVTPQIGEWVDVLPRVS